MKRKKLFIGSAFILTGIWFYMALSTFAVDDTSSPSKLIIREGTVRSSDEIAEVLAKELGFDLEGAYKTGYSSADVIEYLVQQPHKFPVTFYDGKFYEGRKTVTYLIPVSVCILMIVIGVVMTIHSLKSGKTD